MTFRSHAFVVSFSLSLVLVAPVAVAAGNHAGGHGQGHPISGVFGEPGKAADASRTVEITMHDNFYEPERITVAKGETVRFAIKNAGELVHEFNIGTAHSHEEHQKEMQLMVEHGVLEADKINHARMKMDMGGGKTMEHNDPNAVLLEPGKAGEVVWKFSKSAELEFACNVPGHYHAGMVGEIHFK